MCVERATGVPARLERVEPAGSGALISRLSSADGRASRLRLRRPELTPTCCIWKAAFGMVHLECCIWECCVLCVEAMMRRPPKRRACFETLSAGRKAHEGETRLSLATGRRSIAGDREPNSSSGILLPSSFYPSILLSFYRKENSKERKKETEDLL